jgi:hypothetical protein
MAAWLAGCHAIGGGGSIAPGWADPTHRMDKEATRMSHSHLSTKANAVAVIAS